MGQAIDFKKSEYACPNPTCDRVYQSRGYHFYVQHVSECYPIATNNEDNVVFVSEKWVDRVDYPDARHHTQECSQVKYSENSFVQMYRCDAPETQCWWCGKMEEKGDP